MTWVLFIVVLAVSFVAVRIGAIAFQLTGLEWSLAKFQALSCFTGTGFTTKEAELITSNRQRRRIASVLMVLGNAGLVVLVATFARTLSPEQMILKLSIQLLPFEVPRLLLPWVNLGVIIVLVYFVYKFFSYPKVSKGITNFLRRRIIRREIFRKVTFEELLLSTGGYGVTKIEIRQGSPVLDKTLLESNIRGLDITILAIIRGEKTMANPSANERIELGDELLCFGKLGSIREQLNLSD